MKDAKGHGSNSRGGSQDVFLKHQMNIARQTVKMPAAMRGVMGGQTIEQARDLINQHGSAADKAMMAEYDRIPDSQAAGALAQGGAKSAPVPVHSGAAGRKPVMTDELARGVGLDAGNRSMRAAGRTVWNDEDAVAATRAHDRAKGLIPRG